METIFVWITIVVASLIGAVGNIFFKMGTDKLGVIPPHSFLDFYFSLRYLFTPSILVALLLFFLGRFLIGSPLSVPGVTQAFVAMTILSLIFTLILEALVLKQRYDLWTYMGIVIGLTSIGSIGQGRASSWGVVSFKRP
ncbi:MAG: hypothetical protein ACETV1_04240 [Candidatus Bathyarchaeia archaeon]